MKTTITLLIIGLLCVGCNWKPQTDVADNQQAPPPTNPNTPAVAQAHPHPIGHVRVGLLEDQSNSTIQIPDLQVSHLEPLPKFMMDYSAGELAVLTVQDELAHPIRCMIERRPTPPLTEEAANAYIRAEQAQKNEAQAEKYRKKLATWEQRTTGEINLWLRQADPYLAGYKTGTKSAIFKAINRLNTFLFEPVGGDVSRYMIILSDMDDNMDGPEIYISPPGKIHYLIVSAQPLARDKIEMLGDSVEHFGSVDAAVRYIIHQEKAKLTIPKPHTS